MFVRTSCLVIALLCSAPVVAQTPSLRPSYPTYGTLKQSGYANDVFLKAVVLTISRIEFGPPTPLRTLYEQCVRTQATSDCQAFLKTIESAFKANGSFSGVNADEWQNWTGPKINENKFDLYFMRAIFVPPATAQEGQYSIGCFIENDDYSCSRWFNILKARFVSEQKQGTVNPLR